MPDSRVSIDSLLTGQRGAGDAATSVESTAAVEEYSAFSYGRVGRHAQMMVSFVRSSGEVQAFPYATLGRMQTLDRDRGGTLWFSGGVVTIEGEGLQKLWNYLLMHRVAEVVEADRRFTFGERAGGAVLRLSLGEL